MHAEYKVPGGKLVVIDLDVKDHMIEQARLSGDFFWNPRSTEPDQPGPAGPVRQQQCRRNCGSR